jgi:ankyrin repeat protein
MTKTGQPKNARRILVATTIVLGAAGCVSRPTTSLWSVVNRGDNPAVTACQLTADEWKNMAKDPAVFKTEQEDTARQLIARGADVNAKDKRGDSILHGAVYSHWTNIVTILLDGGARPNEKNKEDRTPLFQTVDAGIAEVLISHGADPDARDRRNVTPLHFAAMRDNIEVADCLITNGASIEAEDIEGRTPLHWTGPRVAKGA